MTFAHTSSSRMSRLFSMRGVRRLAPWLTAGALATSTLAGCSPESLVDANPPSTVATPEALHTAAGAAALYVGALNLFANAFGGGTGSGSIGYVFFTGMQTDEFTNGFLYWESVDQRNNSVTFDLGSESVQSVLYQRLQGARTAAFQARQALQRYGVAGNNAAVGRMYSYEAYTIVLLAEYFCNGIPLTTVNLQSDPVYGSALTTDQLYERAIALFDTAITLSADTVSYLNLARVGKGRVLLDQGKFAEAAAAVAAVPQTFSYNVEFSTNGSVAINGTGYGFQNTLGAPPLVSLAEISVLDNEGGRGQLWTGDARVPIDPFSALNLGSGAYPTKYTAANSPIRLADGAEAQLITAEASLFAGNANWLTILNGLRSSCNTASGCTAVTGITGGTTQLPPLADSVTPAKRILQVMSERARWMYATGHRQGDLRRLMHVYDIDDVYPTGPYVSPLYGGKTTVYGSDVVAIPARAEQQYNPLYHGCLDRNP